MSEYEFQVGDKVVIAEMFAQPKDKDVVYEVTKVPTGARGRNYVVTDLVSGRGMRGPGAAFTLADEATVKAAEERAANAPYAPTMGEVVRVKEGLRIDSNELYVVLGDAKGRASAARLVRLGGDEGRYYTSVPHAMLEVVSREDIVVKAND